jgi:hypothetical protein
MSYDNHAADIADDNVTDCVMHRGAANRNRLL